MTSTPHFPKNKWQSYYQKDSLIVKLIELINEVYFSKYFEGIFKKIVDMPDKKLKILEPGCGSGIMSARLSKYFESYLLDISPNALKVALNNFKKEKAIPTGIVQSNILSMPFKNNSFDVVWNQGVVEHFKNREEIIKEMTRIMKPRGKIVLFVPSYLSLLSIAYWILLKSNLKRYWPFDDQEFIKKKELYKELETAGVKNINVKRLKGSFFLSLVGYGEK